MKIITKKLTLFLFFLMLLGVGEGFGQILTYDFAGLTGNETTANSNFNNVNLTNSTISRGVGLTAAANANRFNATDWAITSITNAISGNNYMQFTITPNVGFQFDVSSVVINLKRSNTGPSAIVLRSSVNGYTTNLDTQKTIVDNTTTQTFTFTFAQSNSSTAITYRFYSFAEGIGGSGGIGEGAGNDLIVNGTVTPLAPTFNFSASAASVAENGGSINVIINQSVANACNVNVALTGGSAPNTDYTFTSPTTLNFNGVVTSQTINIPIINNALVDGIRTFILTLQTATGSCTIGTTSTITVTIADDETPSGAGTIFEKGDLAVVAFNTNDFDCSGDQSDFITFICFKDIITNTTFDMTDNGWQRLNANQWGDTEGTVKCTYNGATTITAGTKITFRLPSILGLPVATNWAFTDLGSASTVNMNSDGDQLYFMQGGIWNNPAGAHNATYIGGTVLFGFNSKNVWDDFKNDSDDSGIYPNTRCFTTTIATGKYTRYTGIATATTKRGWIDRISNDANWTVYATCTPYNAVTSPNFVITVGALVNGKWLGGANTNWFDCKNWDDYLIPTPTTNVNIELTTDNNAQISSTAAFATDFNGIAQCNNITLATSTTKILSFATGTTHILQVYGNWNNQKGTTNFTEAGGTVSFLGATAQTITTAGGTETFGRVILNNNAGLSLITTNMLVSSSLTFTNGIITASNANTARVEFLAGSSVTGAGTGKYVAGFVRKVGNTAFNFPVGDEGYYALVGISAPASVTDHFTTTYDRTYASNPYNVSSIKNEGALTLNHVDNCEYWDVQRTNGTSNVFLTLAYEDTRSCKITPGSESDMRVAHWDGTQWENNGNSSTNVVSVTNGTITSGAAISSFSPFTLASISIFNPLPIEIVSFTAKINQNNSAQLDWITVSEVNAKGFDIEKSLDGKTFTKITYQKAIGNVNVIKNYQIIDESFKNAAYYRLKMIDNNDTFKYSKIIYLNNQKTTAYELVIIPNPTQGEVKLVLGNASPTENISLKVISITGKEIVSLVGDILEVEKQLSNQMLLLSAGMYVVHIQIGEHILQTKLIKN